MEKENGVSGSSSSKDLCFEASYSHSGAQEPGCYLHSTAPDTTNCAKLVHPHMHPQSRKSLKCNSVSLLPASILSGQITLLYCTHPALDPPDAKYFKWEQVGPYLQKLVKFRAWLCCSHSANHFKKDISNIALNLGICNCGNPKFSMVCEGKPLLVAMQLQLTP